MSASYVASAGRSAQAFAGRCRGILATALIASLYCAPFLRAQTRVDGRVLDDTGRPVPGARVELKAPASAAVVASSDEAGRFSAELSAAGSYSIKAERQGFYRVELNNQEFGDGPTQLTITLNHVREFSESLEVADSAPVIDPNEPSAKKELDNVQVQSVPYPAPQDFRNALPLMNGVLQDSQGLLHVNGAKSNQTGYTLNGFNIADPVTGRLEARVNIETIESADLETSRFSVESGRGSAGALDLKTRMGDDRWRFGATNFFPGVSFEDGLHFSKWTPRLQLSGPIAKGRAWFHNGFDAFYDVDVVHGLPEGQNRARGIAASNLSRAQLNITSSNILTTSLLANLEDRRNQYLSIINPLETTRSIRRTLFTGSVRDSQYAWGALFTIGFSQTRTFDKETPRGDQIYQITPYGNRGNYFVRSRRHGRRSQGMFDVFLPELKALGRHTVKAGFDMQREGFDQDIRRHDYEVLRADYSLARLVGFEGAGRLQQNSTEKAWYLQDQWMLRAGFAVQGGVRLQKNTLAQGTNAAPRLAVVWSPFNEQTTKVSAGWGIYYDALALGDVARGDDQTSISTFYSGSGVAMGPVRTAFRVNTQQIELPRYANTSLGVEQRAFWDVYLKAEYLRRSGNRGLVFMPGASDNAADLVYELRNVRRDRYRALDFSLHKTFSGQYELFAGYTRSSSRTNAAVDYALENPVFAPQMPGPFPWDSPNRFHAWGWAPVPEVKSPKWNFFTRELTVSYLLEYRTGFPFSVVDDRGVQLGPPGSRRMPAYFNINLHLERKFRALHYLWAWRFGLNNLTNSNNPVSVNNVTGTPNFLTFGRGQSRAFSVRLRLLGKK